MTLVDPTGYLLTTIRDNPAVAALTTRVRAGEPASGDALGAPYQRFIVLVQLGRQRERRVPTQEVRYVARAYGLTHQDATALAGAVSDAVHGIGPVRNASGVVMFQAFDDGGEGSTADPGTGQPHSDVVISVVAGTQVAPIA